MKKISKVLSAVALSAALCMGAAGVAFADSSVTFQDHAKVFVFANGSEYTETDLFDGLKGVCPGDNLRQHVSVTNSDSDGREVTIYLGVEAHEEETNPLSENVAAAGKDVVSMEDFLAQLDMTVRLGDDVLFTGKAHEAGLGDPVSLGSFANGQTKQITVELSVPIDMDNTYANRVGEVDWVFTVEELDEEPEPLPDTGLSQTGDDLPVVMLAGLAVAAVAIALAAFFALRRRSHR